MQSVLLEFEESNSNVQLNVVVFSHSRLNCHQDLSQNEHELSFSYLGGLSYRNVVGPVKFVGCESVTVLHFFEILSTKVERPLTVVFES